MSCNLFFGTKKIKNQNGKVCATVHKSGLVVLFSPQPIFVNVNK